ncbi:MAG: ATP synthase F1 subunit delta [Chitinispirillaceae bacterium]|nr:ATP synthase F1 subunit delta [Chitinispirillaceae bacterium]
MISRLAAREYARVLTRLAPDEAASVLDYIRGLGCSMETDAQVRHFLNHPAIPDSEKLRSLESTAPAPFGPLVRQVFADIIRRRSTALLSAIADEMVAMADEAAKIRTVQVTSAVPLANDARAALSGRLEHYTNSSVKVQYTVDERLVSGLLVKIGDTIIDNTIRTDLEHIRHQLLTASPT